MPPLSKAKMASRANGRWRNRRDTVDEGSANDQPQVKRQRTQQLINQQQSLPAASAELAHTHSPQPMDVVESDEEHDHRDDCDDSEDDACLAADEAEEDEQQHNEEVDKEHDEEVDEKHDEEEENRPAPDWGDDDVDDAMGEEDSDYYLYISQFSGDEQAFLDAEHESEIGDESDRDEAVAAPPQLMGVDHSVRPHHQRPGNSQSTRARRRKKGRDAVESAQDCRRISDFWEVAATPEAKRSLKMRLAQQYLRQTYQGPFRAMPVFARGSIVVYPTHSRCFLRRLPCVVV